MKSLNSEISNRWLYSNYASTALARTYFHIKMIFKFEIQLELSKHNVTLFQFWITFSYTTQNDICFKPLTEISFSFYTIRIRKFGEQISPNLKSLTFKWQLSLLLSQFSPASLHLFVFLLFSSLILFLSTFRLNWSTVMLYGTNITMPSINHFLLDVKSSLIIFTGITSLPDFSPFVRIFL